jgi:hypothetical protein
MRHASGGKRGAGFDSDDESDRPERQAGGERERCPGHDVKVNRQPDGGDECRQTGMISVRNVRASMAVRSCSAAAARTCSTAIPEPGRGRHEGVMKGS